MRFKLLIKADEDEEIVARVHARSELTDKIEQLVIEHNGDGKFYAIHETREIIRELSLDEIECITVLDGKTYFIDRKNEKYISRKRLYEIEETLPESFIRINKSAIANRKYIKRFESNIGGAVSVKFLSGYTDYVSRRCFAEIKRRFNIK